MTVEFGTSNKGKPIVIYRNSEYVKERDTAELHHGVVRNFKVCSAKLAWSPTVIVLSVTDSQSALTRAM